MTASDKARKWINSHPIGFEFTSEDLNKETFEDKKLLTNFLYRMFKNNMLGRGTVTRKYKDRNGDTKSNFYYVKIKYMEKLKCGAHASNKKLDVTCLTEYRKTKSYSFAYGGNPEIIRDNLHYK